MLQVQPFARADVFAFLNGVARRGIKPGLIDGITARILNLVRGGGTVMVDGKLAGDPIIRPVSQPPIITGGIYRDPGDTIGSILGLNLFLGGSGARN